jgi:hypothetical protein
MEILAICSVINEQWSLVHRTLLPINRSPEKKPAEVVEATPTKQPLSALQQALMSPPGHLTAMLQSPAKVAAESRPKATVKPEGVIYFNALFIFVSMYCRIIAAKPIIHSSSRSSSSHGSPRGRTVRDERSPNKELVNCMCGVPEEDGLMIQVTKIAMYVRDVITVAVHAVVL